MRRAARRWLVLLLLLLVLSPVLLYLLASYWLESAGGRKALEGELTRRVGLPVHLLGEFDIMLLPVLGVEGTELLIGGTGADEELVRSGEYSVALALAPLLAGEMRVETVRLAGGSLRLDRLPSNDKAAASSPGAELRLPSIDEFAVSDFTIVAPGEQPARFEVDELTVEGFGERRDTKFRLAIAGYGRVAGQLRWDPALSALNLDGSWEGPWPGDLEFSVQVDLTEESGNLAARWPAGPASPDEVVAIASGFVVRDGAVRLPELEIAAGRQSVRGGGCLRLGGTPALQLELAADELDLDKLPELPPFGTPAGAEQPAAAGLDLDIRLTATEIRRAGAVARQAVLSLGGEPDCSDLD
jgi:hypothetical protein